MHGMIPALIGHPMYYKSCSLKWPSYNVLLSLYIQEHVIGCGALGYVYILNSLAPGKFEWNFRHVIFKQILVIDGWGISCEIAQIWMPLDLPDDKSTLVQVLVWCRQATSHYLSPCRPRSLMPYGVTRPQWINSLAPGQNGWNIALFPDLISRIKNYRYNIFITISLKSYSGFNEQQAAFQINRCW